MTAELAIATSPEFERTPPQALEAEMSVLGGMLLSKDAIADVIEIIKSGDFYRPAHQTVFDAIVDLYGRGDPADAVTVMAELTRLGELARIGGGPYLHSLVASVPTAASAGFYARIVRDSAVLRRLVEAGTRIVQLGYAGKGGDVDDLVDRAQQAIFEVTERRTSEDYIPLGDLLQPTLLEIEAIGARDGTMHGVPTGFADLDTLTNGLHGGQLVILAARPAIGKCVSYDTVITNAATGERMTIEEFVRRGQAGEQLAVESLDESWRFKSVTPSDFIDNGIQQVFKLTTRAGRTLRATATHPLRTLRGWLPLNELGSGDRIAAPRTSHVGSDTQIADGLVALTAYLLGDGSVINTTARLTAVRSSVILDATTWASNVGVEARRVASRPCNLLSPCDRPLIHRRPGEVGHRHYVGLSFATPAGQLNPLGTHLREIGLSGQTSHTKRVPAAYMRLGAGQLRLFLSRLYATDGWASVQWVSRRPGAEPTPVVEIGYCSVSEGLARDVAHLLLRFGITAFVRHRKTSCNGVESMAWCVDIHDAEGVTLFCTEVGIFGKEEALDEVLEALDSRGKPNGTRDNLPAEIWDVVDAERGITSWGEINRRLGLPASHNWHASRRRPLGRAQVARLAEALGSVVLSDLAHSEVIWDEIVSIEPDGMDRVYDLTVDGTHNFVANDIVVHNSTLGLDLARAASIKHSLASVIFSLEMSKHEITMRLLSAEARVSLQSLRTGKMTDDDWTRLARRMGEVADAPLFIDDSPNLTMMEIRAKARRLKQRNDLRLVVVDYMQLMSSPKRVENRQQEVSEISRSLKLLAKELDVPVVAISQLNRSPEQRADKKPQLSDLRESGSLEQDADMVILLYREDAFEKESPRAGEADFIVAKHRNGPTATVTVAFQGHYSRFVDMTPNG